MQPQLSVNNRYVIIEASVFIGVMMQKKATLDMDTFLSVQAVVSLCTCICTCICLYN